MKKVCIIEDLCCAHCAMKMEEALGRIDGVESARVNFLSGRVTLEADEARMADILCEAEKVCRRIEPDCRLIIK